jgi:hypothetical protein
MSWLREVEKVCKNSIDYWRQNLRLTTYSLSRLFGFAQQKYTYRLAMAFHQEINLLPNFPRLLALWLSNKLKGSLQVRWYALLLIASNMSNNLITQKTSITTKSPAEGLRLGGLLRCSRALSFVVQVEKTQQRFYISHYPRCWKKRCCHYALNEMTFQMTGPRDNISRFRRNTTFTPFLP